MYSGWKKTILLINEKTFLVGTMIIKQLKENENLNLNNN